MSIKICTAPCCWGVDDPKNPYLPHWTQVLHEASRAGYKGIELGPYGYLPIDVQQVSDELAKNDLFIVAGTIFDDLVSIENQAALEQQAHNICQLITKLPQVAPEQDQKFATPYLVLIDWGHDERDYAAGHPDTAPRLSQIQWQQMISHIKNLAAIAQSYGIRAVIHPHAGGYIEFADEIDKVVRDIPYDLAGLCLDTGHLYYSKIEPLAALKKYWPFVDYLHFKDIDLSVYQKVMNEKIRFFEACAKGVMCRIGEGTLAYPEIYRLLKALNYQGYITVEQERDPRNSGSSLDDVKISRDYLKRIGF
ncbi:TIM barrel protein [Testudinibacter sp. TR-2022]|uniref:TIM barrel protein n=1 Tax=Testudinibacter sp. TR-2022 TaxID=2585029 RepID=UPI00111919FD|nr:TIM barrel protein [Testudinibacter sp. TR-2022]TNH05427.1 TIM barrel protein [Pasteurellaceae bacterium Phil11]TNH21539.1 TIM barrel protein [Testudinibacter sp. TR-2022]TNH25940.1 TIM barrel protein [Testudinibacter sp. TR-2022]